MSTPETDPSLPGIADLTALANEFFHSSADTPVPTGTPSAPPATLPPPAPVSPPSPAVAPRLHSAPLASAVGTAHPLPGVTGPVIDLPRVPLIPDHIPPDARTGIPAALPSVGSPGYAAPLPAEAPAFFQFPLLPESLDPFAAAPLAVSVHEPLPADAGVQAFSPALVPAVAAAPTGFDPNLARRDFPILRTQVHGKPLIWLDNAATTQKPQAVIDRLAYFYGNENSNIHRAAHTLAARATDAYEGARESVRRFIGAASTDEIVFVRGTTEGINLIAKSWGAANIGEGDEILITHLEHHANIVPWQQLCEATGAVLRVAPVDDNGDLIVEEFERLLGPRTKLASLTHVSNALGTVTPVEALVGIAHAHGVPIVVDVAQSVAHAPLNVVALDADFVVFSGHKIYGPTGIGAVYGKRAILESMPPWEGGGNMIGDVTFERTTFHGPPARFEAGTGNIADAVGLGAALDYVSGWGIGAVAAYEHGLIDYLAQQLATVDRVRLLGAPTHRAGAVSFVVDGLATDEVGKALDKEGIAVRSGHHCAQPILRRFGVEASVRPSLALYNTTDDVDQLITALRRIVSTR